MADSRTNTSPPDVSMRRLRWARAGRRVFFLLICGVLVAAGLGLVGVRPAEVQAVGGGYELTVTYDDITRGGLAATLDIEVRRAGGFPASLTLAISSDYLANFDSSAVDPDPIGATSTSDQEILTFETPKRGDTMTVSFDMRVQPGLQVKRAKATVAILDGGTDPVATARLSTLVMP